MPSYLKSKHPDANLRRRNHAHRSIAPWALVALAAATATSPVASAADCCRWELEVYRVPFGSNRFVVNLYAHFPAGPDAFFNTAVLDIRATAGKWTSVELRDPMGGRAGQINGASVDEILMRQIALPGMPVDTSNPLLVWSGEFDPGGCPSVPSFAIALDIRTKTRLYTHAELGSCPSVSCTPVEAVRSVYSYCGPTGPGDFWLAAPAAGTRGAFIGETLHLTPETPGGDIDVSLGDERIDWSQGAGFGAKVDFASLDIGAAISFSWYPWALCSPVIEPKFSIAATKSGARDLLVTPDFSAAAISTVPVRAYLRDELVSEAVLAAGAGFRIFDWSCDNWIWCYHLNAEGKLVLRLQCDDELGFSASLAGGPPVEADRIELAPVGIDGAFGGVDRLQLVARGTRELIVLDAGEVTPGGDCYADCDQSGSLDIFDFLCFTDAFAAGELYADCDGSGSLDIFDFLCFTDAFAAGCP